METWLIWKTFVISDKPKHRFNVETKSFQTGKKAGLTRHTVTLEIGKHKFSRGTVRNDIVYFTCNGCKSIKIFTLAKARKWSDEEYELLDWPVGTHICS